MFLVFSDQKQISSMLDRKIQSLVIKVLSFQAPYTVDFRLKTKIACRNDDNLLCALGFKSICEHINLIAASIRIANTDL